jgi:AcrR family transcriptional regulator
MEEQVKRRRPYRSQRREEQARETRARIVEAAHRAFVEQGYGGATITAIAADAGVSAETVYAVFRNKRTLLTEVIGAAARGDEPTPILEQPGASAVAAEPDPREKLRLFTSDIRRRVARVAPLMAVLAAAGGEEPELEELRSAMHEHRRRNLREVARMLGETGALRTDLESATETIWAMASPELYALVTGPGEWTPERYEAWLADSLAALLLRP